MFKLFTTHPRAAQAASAAASMVVTTVAMRLSEKNNECYKRSFHFEEKSKVKTEAQAPAVTMRKKPM